MADTVSGSIGWRSVESRGIRRWPWEGALDEWAGRKGNLQESKTGLEERSGYIGRWKEIESVWQDGLDQRAGGREM